MEGSGSWRRVVVNTEIKARPYGLAPPGFRLPEAARLGSDLATNVWARGPAPSVDEAQLLAWELIMPVSAPTQSLEEVCLVRHGFGERGRGS
jgi:hypothetical protein